jgi:hypothetical protein
LSKSASLPGLTTLRIDLGFVRSRNCPDFCARFGSARQISDLDVVDLRLRG